MDVDDSDPRHPRLVVKPEKEEPVSLEVRARRIKELAASLASDRMDALKLYEPLPAQKEFIKSEAKYRLLYGSNRSGKTLTAAYLVAAAARGRLEGFPQQDARIYVVGRDQRHIGEVFYRKLFKAGAFKVMFDTRGQVMRWRVVKPDDKYDREHQDLWKPAPPLIPPTEVESIAYESKKENIISLVRMKNGTELRFFPSNTEPPQGMDIDLAWIDEEIVRDDWWSELAARIIDRGGKIFWSATPETGTYRLFELHLKASDPEQPNVAEFFLSIEDNPYIARKDKDDFKSTLRPDEIETKYDGHFAIHAREVYPEFNMTYHGVDPIPVPSHWTRYMVVDPGAQICGVLFVAVTPPEEGDFVHFYRQLYIRRCTAAKFAKEVKSSLAEGEEFEDFVMDMRGGRQHEKSSGKTIEAHYAEALEEAGIACRRHRHGFAWGSDDVPAREQAFKKWLQPRTTDDDFDGTCRLRVHRGKLPDFEREVRLQFYKQNSAGTVLDKRDDVRDSHLMDCAEYAAAYEPKWRKREKRKASKDSPALRALAAKRERLRRQNPGANQRRLGPINVRE